MTAFYHDHTCCLDKNHTPFGSKGRKSKKFHRKAGGAAPIQAGRRAPSLARAMLSDTERA